MLISDSEETVLCHSRTSASVYAAACIRASAECYALINMFSCSIAFIIMHQLASACAAFSSSIADGADRANLGSGGLTAGGAHT